MASRTPRIRLALAFGALALSVGFQPARAEPPPPPESVPPRTISVEPYALANGLRVWIQPVASSHEAHVRLVVQAGSGSEPDDGNGLAHFAEHMLFDRETDPTIHSLIQRIELGGGYYNAFTTVDTTYAMVDSFASDLELALELIATSLEGSPFTPEQLEIERQILLRELAEKADDALLMGLREQLYGDQPVARPEGGTAESVSRISGREVKAFVEEHYRPPALVLIVVTGRPVDEVREAVERLLGGLAWSGLAPPGYAPPERNPGPIQFEDAEHAGTLLHGIATPGARDPDYHALWVLQELLELKLYDRIRVQGGLSYAPYVYFTPNRFEGLLYLYAAAEEASFAAMADAFDRELERVANGEVPNDEVNQARLRVSNRFLRERHDSGALADHLVWLAGVLDPGEVPQDPVAPLRHVSRRDLERVAERLATPDSRVDARTVEAPAQEQETELATRLALWLVPAALVLMLGLQVLTLLRMRRLRKDLDGVRAAAPATAASPDRGRGSPPLAA